ncbi:GNAT family N-acetyltransferase [Alteromonas sp.]|jgi:ElaA protein|nr:GNAT family N-acetyltransferase [Alteromonas sp.]
MLSWVLLPFDELTTHQLFDVLKLRVDVFVVEQECAYPELDEKDRHPETRHLMGFSGQELVAYARLIPPGLSYESASIGRVVTAADYRRNGAGKALLKEAIHRCGAKWPHHNIEIGAQEYLLDFYQSFGFEASSPVYLEDGIPHLDMKKFTTN